MRTLPLYFLLDVNAFNNEKNILELEMKLWRKGDIKPTQVDFKILPLENKQEIFKLRK